MQHISSVKTAFKTPIRKFVRSADSLAYILSQNEMCTRNGTAN